MHSLSQLLLSVLYSPPPRPPEQHCLLLLCKITLSTRPLVSPGLYFTPTGTAETLLAGKPVKNSEAVTLWRNEEKSALQ